MNEYIISNLSGFGGAIIGGVFSLFAAGITLKYQYKKEQELQKFRYLEEDKKWLREKRIDLFVELVDVLESYQLPLITEENTEFGYVNKMEIENYINTTNEYLDKNKGKLFLFLPSEIFSQIVRMRGKMCNIAFSNEPQKIYYSDLKNNEMFNTVIEAKKISQNIQKLLGIKD
ncbi:MAG: hypothetical protein K2H13_08590 [Eubacterium sp.]|nr:hypothetical protein [Eubacterium sp.]